MTQAHTATECKVDQLTVTSVTALQPAKGMDKASKALTKEAISSAVTAGVGKMIGKVLAAKATSAGLAFGKETATKFCWSRGLILDYPRY